MFYFTAVSSLISPTISFGDHFLTLEILAFYSPVSGTLLLSDTFKGGKGIKSNKIFCG